MTHYKIIQGIKCYHAESAECYADYPSLGFDLTEQLEETHFWFRARNRILIQLILKYTQTAATFLEIGCGTGFFLRELAKQSNLQLTGSDIYLAGLRYAKAKLPHIQYLQFDVTRFQTNDLFNMIGSFDVLEHITEDNLVLKNIYQSLSINGYLLLTVPQYPFLWSHLDDFVKHKRRYRRKELIKQLQQAGFEITFQTSFVFVLFPFMLISRLLNLTSTKTNEFEQHVKIPKIMNWLFDKVMRIDELLIRLGISLPFGGSLIIMARKKC